MSEITTTEVQTVAVIDIGSSAIRMLVAQVGPKSDIRYLENLHKPIRLGKDVFINDRISPQTVRESISILKDFKSVIESYGIKKIEAIATTAVRDAANRDNFIDRVYVRTGIDVEVIEGAEQNRLELIAAEHAFGDQFKLEDRDSLIIEVGSGSTELIVLEKGEVSATQTLALGSIRLPEDMAKTKAERSVIQRVLKRHISDISKHTAFDFNFKELNTFVALGGDVRFLAKELVPSSSESYVTLDKKAFTSFVTKIGKLTVEEIVRQYNLPYEEAETLYPALLIYINFLNETGAEEIVIPSTSIRDGLLLELAQMLSKYKRTDVSKQVLHSARHLGVKYDYDKAHGANVASIAVKIYDALKDEHGLGSKERLLLEVSSILHDIGSYISAGGHHKHSSYLVNASEIFGLRKSDKDIVANVIRYHRRATPKESHVAYMSLPKSTRSTVSKLAAILRVADALDHSHQQKIKEVEVEIGEKSFHLWVPEEVGDISMERENLRFKGEMFADVFGAPVGLKQRRVGIVRKTTA